MQAFSPVTRDGTVLLDDGSPLGFDVEAFAAGGLLRLRPGQRVAIDIVAGRVRVVTLATFPLPER